MSIRTESTAEKILSSTIDLMSEKGYKAVTIKEIAAAASVSEMTVFRTFGSKKAILDAIIDNYMFSSPIEQTIQQNLKYELETDLLMISELYHDVLARNKKIYLISILERKTMPEIHLSLHNKATKFLSIVTEYFRVMQQQGKVVKGNPETQAITLMKFNYGKFVAGLLLEGIAPASPNDNLQASIAIIAKGLTI
ncbi:TetR/AcrR family transcriptional regulator [Paenibacillus sp. OAS669]|uniref:TetR/AcrR family transcriptional regulator n=1 Tax=Paenibacillus sp. OAS669 TaxID=2663821 RepID=UPI00178AE4C0|nr:TetR/AcrR family transcriptional regulator [Paenibacillus sp. OAS669]MBE1443825.1 AcrR family transcriptional regulator [Paenibacillus sp. OAS669]